MYTTVDGLVNRLSEVEKIKIRGASSASLEWLFYNIFQYEIDLPEDQALEMFWKVKLNVMEKFTENSKTTGFGRTWAF